MSTFVVICFCHESILGLFFRARVYLRSHHLHSIVNCEEKNKKIECIVLDAKVYSSSCSSFKRGTNSFGWNKSSVCFRL
jgi:hypothetical protein